MIVKGQVELREREKTKNKRYRQIIPPHFKINHIPHPPPVMGAHTQRFCQRLRYYLIQQHRNQRLSFFLSFLCHIARRQSMWDATMKKKKQFWYTNRNENMKKCLQSYNSPPLRFQYAKRKTDGEKKWIDSYARYTLHLSLSITITMCGYMAVVAFCYVVHTGYIIEDKKKTKEKAHTDYRSFIIERFPMNKQSVCISLHLSSLYICIGIGYRRKRNR